MNNSLKEFVHKAIFHRQVRTVDEILKQARKSRFNTNRAEIYATIEEVCTPYKAKRR